MGNAQSSNRVPRHEAKAEWRGNELNVVVGVGGRKEIMEGDMGRNTCHLKLQGFPSALRGLAILNAMRSVVWCKKSN